MSIEIKLTDEQHAVKNAVRQLSESIMVEAGAGCAKTSTLKLSAPGLKVPTLALAFNRRIADDLVKALPKHFAVKTLNGLGHSAWAKGIGLEPRDLKVDSGKGAKVLKNVLSDLKIRLTEDEYTDLTEVIRGAMAGGLVPSVSGGEFLDDSQDSWIALGESCDCSRERSLWLAEMAREFLKEDIKLARSGMVSFDDQVYCSVALGGRFPRFPAVIVDEDQDLSSLNIKMLELALAPGGRLVAVGDRRQAIYAWRGAAGDAAERIRRITPAWHQLPLLTTFRCPRSVVERQQGHVPGFRAWEGAEDGAVHQFVGEWGWADVGNLLPNPRASIAVLCRNNAPLLRFAMKLIRMGIGCRMLGRDIGKGLEVLVKRLATDEGCSAGELLARLSDWETQARATAEGKAARLESIGDKAECVRAVTQGRRTSADVLAALREIFSDATALVTLSSIHRAKGLEWDFVLHLDPWRVPAKFATTPVEVEQEANALYVCETRTRHTLVTGNLKDWREVDVD